MQQLTLHKQREGKNERKMFIPASNITFKHTKVYVENHPTRDGLFLIHVEQRQKYTGAKGKKKRNIILPPIP